MHTLYIYIYSIHIYIYIYIYTLVHHSLEAAATTACEKAAP